MLIDICWYSNEKRILWRRFFFRITIGCVPNRLHIFLFTCDSVYKVRTRLLKYWCSSFTTWMNVFSSFLVRIKLFFNNDYIKPMCWSMHAQRTLFLSFFYLFKCTLETAGFRRIPKEKIRGTWETLSHLRPSTYFGGTLACRRRRATCDAVRRALDT